MKISDVILIIGVIGTLLIILKVMQMMKAQTEMAKSQTDLLLAVAVKTGAAKPQQQPSSSKSKATVSAKTPQETQPEEDEEDPYVRKAEITPANKKTLKLLFGDEVPKTAGQLRAIYNHNNSKPMDAKKFNTLLWNFKGRGILRTEKLEDSDSVWGLVEWFDGKQLSEEFFKKIKS